LIRIFSNQLIKTLHQISTQLQLATPTKKTTTNILTQITSTTNLQANNLALSYDQNLFRNSTTNPVNSTTSKPTITNNSPTALTNQHLQVTNIDQAMLQPTDQNFPSNINIAPTCNTNNNTTTNISPLITNTTNLQANNSALNFDQSLFRNSTNNLINSTNSIPTITTNSPTTLTNQHLNVTN
jgi:nitrate/nitrite-specific signal transduction histidine kinase